MEYALIEVRGADVHGNDEPRVFDKKRVAADERVRKAVYGGLEPDGLPVELRVPGRFRGGSGEDIARGNDLGFILGEFDWCRFAPVRMGERQVEEI